ncbi:MAG: DUF3189 family protein [Firmicutes bacterium]|nr:DUF3189 family protein [Bacillota bacterium]
MAAAVHVGLLAPHPCPSRQVLMSLPYFDTQKSADHGILQFVGTDQAGNVVCSVGLQTAADTVIKALANLMAIAGAGGREIVFIDTLPAVNLWMKIGGICSRVFGLKAIGRPLVVFGVKRAFPSLVSLVNRALMAEQKEV